MTPNEAINLLDEVKTIDDSMFQYSTAYMKALDMAIGALKKQIPMKPITSDQPRYGMGYEYYDWFCPTCSRFLAFDAQISNLPPICKCGQKIDWSKEE